MTLAPFVIGSVLLYAGLGSASWIILLPEGRHTTKG